MQNVLEKPKLQKPQLEVQNDSKNVLTLDDILKFYKNKNKTSLIGLEYERLSLYKDSLKNVSYLDIEPIMLDFSRKTGWDLVYDNDTIIQMNSKDGSSISLEPGRQLEISLKPLNRIIDIDIELSKITSLLDKIANIYNITFLPYGITPVSDFDDIELLDKERYKVMYSYLPIALKGELAPKMMKKTAGIQINVDYFDDSDAYYKLKFLNMISPFVASLLANSPIENNRLTGNKTNRCNVWRHTGSQRCNLFYKNIFKGLDFINKNNTIKNYVEEILKVPMIYIEKEGKIIAINGKITFEEYMLNGYQGYIADIKDYILHQSLCFPDVRLKQYIEIRNHDASSKEIALSLCAFYKGLMANDIKKMIKKFNFIKLEDFETHSKNLVKTGLDYKVKDISGWQIVKELLELSKRKLNSKDRSYLQPLKQMILFKKTQADIIIDYDIRTAKDLVNFLAK